jgi:hypothetical protein
MTYFRIKDLENFLQRNKFVLSTVKIAQRLRDLQGNPHSITIKSRTIRTWRIPAYEKQDSPFDVNMPNTGSPF